MTGLSAPTRCRRRLGHRRGSRSWPPRAGAWQPGSPRSPREPGYLTARPRRRCHGRKGRRRSCDAGNHHGPDAGQDVPHPVAVSARRLRVPLRREMVPGAGAGRLTLVRRLARYWFGSCSWQCGFHAGCPLTMPSPHGSGAVLSRFRGRVNSRQGAHRARARHGPVAGPLRRARRPRPRRSRHLPQAGEDTAPWQALNLLVTGGIFGLTG